MNWTAPDPLEGTKFYSIQLEWAHGLDFSQDSKDDRVRFSSQTMREPSHVVTMMMVMMMTMMTMMTM